MPKTAAKFGHELQAALQPMIIKPSGSGGVQVRFSFFSFFLWPALIEPFLKILQETVGCMCVVVQYLTHDFVRLVNLLKSCNGRFSILMFWSPHYSILFDIQDAFSRWSNVLLHKNWIRPNFALLLSLFSLCHCLLRIATLIRYGKRTLVRRFQSIWWRL